MGSHSNLKAQVIRTYARPVIRAYCTIRFRIMNTRILEEIGQYLPNQGRLLDVGCGFGLFSLYYALQSPGRQLTGYDISERRIPLARTSAAALGVSDRTAFHQQDVTGLQVEAGAYDAAYMLDILHHVPTAAHEELIRSIHRALAPGGILLLKDIDCYPWWKVLFTWVLDVAMTPSAPPNYVPRSDVTALLERIGFDVKIHAFRDILPYPHALYICRKLPDQA